jgi:hypothetical protein
VRSSYSGYVCSARWPPVAARWGATQPIPVQKRPMTTTRTERHEKDATFRTCVTCQTWNPAYTAKCCVCGTPLDGDYDISFTLSFHVAECEECGHVSPTTPCVHCGADVPEAKETDKLALARRKAFAPLLARAEQLQPRYETLPEPHVPVAPDQYASALADARVLKRATIVLRSLHRLSELELNDEKAIGSSARNRLKRLVIALEELYRETEQVAWFRAPSSEVARARTALIATGRHMTDAIVTLLRALSAPSADDVGPLQARFQGLLADFPFTAEFATALSALRELPSGDTDERVSVALGTDIIVSDDFGLLDPARLLAAFAGGDDPFTPLACASARYLSHLIDLDPESVTAEGAALSLAAFGLAVLDRPLPAHTLARDAVRLLKEAEARDPTAAAALLDRTVGEGPRIFAAAKRIEDDLYYLSRDLARDEDDVVGRLLGTYKRLAESSFRNYVWLVVDAQDLVAGQTRVASDRAPMLGELLRRLAVRDDALSKALVRAIDAVLRNAEAHEDFRLDANRLEIVLDGKRISLDRFAKKLERLVSAAVALDAAFSCRAFETGTPSTVPQWLASGEAPFATELLTRAFLGAYEIDLIELQLDADLTLLVDWDAPERVRAMTPLCAVAQLFAGARRLVLRVEGNDEPLISVETAAFRAFAEASEATKDLAVLGPLYSVGVESGREEQAIIEDVLALFIALIAATDVPRLRIALGIGNPASLVLFEERLAYVIAFVRERCGKLSPTAENALKSLTAAKNASIFVRRGDDAAARRIINALVRAAGWAESRGYRWPLV